MRSLWPSLAGTVCFTQAGKISSRPSLLCALAPLAVSRVYCRGLGMIIDGARVLELDARAGRRHGDVVDAAQIVVGMMVRRMIGAGRIDVGPAAGDVHRILVDLQEARDAAGRRLDQLHEFGEGRPLVQVLRRLPVAAGRNLGPRRDQPLDLGLQLGVERRGLGGLEVDDPEGRREEFLDFLLLDHGGEYSPHSS